MTTALPHFAAAFHVTTGAPIIMERGVTGYYLMDHDDDPDRFNERLGVTPAQREAMIVGSMFGWNVPRADPALWENAKPEASFRPVDIRAALNRHQQEFKNEVLAVTSSIQQLKQEREALLDDIDELERTRNALRAQQESDQRLEVIRQRKEQETAQRALQEQIEASAKQRKLIEQGPDFGCF